MSRRFAAWLTDRLTSVESIDADDMFALVRSNVSMRAPWSTIVAQTGSWVSVLDPKFGVPSSEASDASTGINDAIEYAYENKIGTVLLPSRIYSIGSAITTMSGVNLLGMGQRMWASGAEAARDRGTLLRALGDMNVVNVSGTSGSAEGQIERVMLQNMTIDGANFTTVGANIQDFRSVVLRDTMFWRCTTGIKPGSTTTDDTAGVLGLDNTHIANCELGMDSSASATKVFLSAYNTNVRSCSTAGIRGAYAGGIYGGFMGAMSGYGFDLIGARPLDIHGIPIENALHPIRLTAGCESVNMQCFSISSSGVIAGDIGIDVQDLSGGTILGVTLNGANQDAGFIGIKVGATGDGMLIGGNRFKNITGGQARFSLNAAHQANILDHTQGTIFRTSTPTEVTGSTGGERGP